MLFRRQWQGNQVANHCEVFDNRFRLKLRHPPNKDWNLQKVLVNGRAKDAARQQAQAMECTLARESRPERRYHCVNQVRTATPNKNINRKPNRKPIHIGPKKSCDNCGQAWPHPAGRTGCPTYDCTCRSYDKQKHFQKYCRFSKMVIYCDGAYCADNT